MDLGQITVKVLNFITSFHIQLLVLSLLSCLKLPRKKWGWLCFLVTVIPYMMAWYYLDIPNLFLVGWFSGGFIFLFFWLVFILYFSFNISFRYAFFYTTSAYTVQHLLYWVKLHIEYQFFPEGRNLTYFWISFGVMLIVCMIYYIFFVRQYERERNIQSDNRSLLLFSVFMIFVVNVISQMSQNMLKDNGAVSTGLYAILCCILLLIVQYRIFDQSRIEREKEIAEQLLREAEKQQRMFKESLDIINLKCHDLKHQISAIKYIDSPLEQKQIIEEVENATAFFSSIAKTGNETLDVVLTEKCLQAEKHKIQLTYIADGSLLDFFTTADLAAFFGNILDNAIESVQETEPERRIIYFSVDKRADYVWIHEENWCDAKLVFKDGFPVTTKADKEYHGYGVVSLRLIAEKYHAELRMEQRGDMFYMDALFPFQDGRKNGKQNQSVPEFL